MIEEETTGRLDFGALRFAIEDRDPDALLGFYAEDAELRVVEAGLPGAWPSIGSAGSTATPSAHEAAVSGRRTTTGPSAHPPRGRQDSPEQRRWANGLGQHDKE